jgi:ATP-dependent RNA helicase DeaD
MKDFKQLGLKDETVNVLSELGIEKPTEIQEKTIPLVLAGKDVIGGSSTGSGKTLAFASSIVENLEKNNNIQALILTPTRELAEQVSEAIRGLSKHKRLNVLPVYGGVRIDSQIKKLKQTDVVVATPGRLLDHLNRKTINLDKVKFLVLDEVDRMFDMGFQEDVSKILDHCPKERQTMLFSATITPGIDFLANKYTKNSQEISVKSHVDPSKLKQIYYDVPNNLKFSLFVQLLKKEKSGLVMVFCATRRNVDFVTKNLKNLGIHAKAIHGGLAQNKRKKVLGDFNSEGGVNVLICTDVAARGLDISGVSHVYNYDIPNTSGEYIHRIGRTARAGKEGIAINILSSRDYERFSDVRRDDKLKIKEKPLPYINKVDIIVSDRKPRNRNKRGFKRNNNNNNWYGKKNNFRKKRKNSKKPHKKNKKKRSKSGLSKEFLAE